MSVTDFLERARRHEAQESWGEALYLYERAIAQLADEGAQDAALHSRVGDLQLRLNRPKAAATAYDEAIELFTRAMDLDGAFAVCQKILRHLPELDDVYLRIARIRAMQGYTEWARQHYLTYAQLKGAKGERDVAVRTLEELVAVVPDDVDTRLFVAERLTAEGRRADALGHLEDGYRRAVGASQPKSVARLRERILALAPDTVLAEFAPSDGEETRLAFETSEVVGRTGPKQRKSGSLARLLGALGLGRTSAVPPGVEDGHVEDEGPSRSMWERPTSETRGREGTAEPHTEAPAGAAAPEAAQPAEGPQAIDPWEGVLSSSAPGEPEEVEQPWEAASTADVREAAEPAQIIDSWQTPETYETATEWTHTEEAEPEEEVAYAEAAAETPLVAEPEPEPAAAPVAASAAPDPEPAALSEEDALAAEEAAVLELLAEEPFEVAHHERFVRYAAKRGEPELLIEGLFHMAIALRAAGLEWRAKSTLARIMSMDPTNVRVLEALGYGGPGAASDPFLRGVSIDSGALQAVSASAAAAQRASAFGEPVRNETAAPAPFVEPLQPSGLATAGSGEPPAEGYVDLAAMILDDLPEPSTRWQVEFTEPAPNEEADFGKILAQFKDQVSQHLERSDARAHYDLGSAYKQMGLVHEAIAMFQKALRADQDFLPAIEMLGRCFLDNGEADAGIKVLNRGLEVKVPVEDDLLGVYYYLGNAFELQGNREAAQDYYMKVFARDINFLDVTDRLRALRREVATPVSA